MKNRRRKLGVHLEGEVKALRRICCHVGPGAVTPSRLPLLLEGEVRPDDR